MNYAQKELAEAIAYLAQARDTEETLRQIGRALELGEPVEITLRCKGATATSLCPTKAAAKVVDKLAEQAQARVRALEKQELYWCAEVVHLNRRAELDEQAREQRTGADAAARIAAGDPSAPQSAA
ncbi:hypothetical protein [Hymenobacter guriensis]|uniref:Uncharacterized protein n=1 Tax=Hymenobacter guriensis TaxID=2793065 RepID=A0ABS0KZL0_9BACT|nr:hypothetical protein [Hymenobacter guriensis]MBG8552572.1 hypothetical protein [Hymenobacter guriensis]